MYTVFLRNMLVLVLPLLLCIFISCRKEASLLPGKAQDPYTLPQGNQPYDDSIVAFYQKYGSYILYRFTEKDLVYDYSSYLSVKGTPGNPAYIRHTLNYFKSQCLDFYPESFLKKTMPFKILLAAAIDTFSTEQVISPVTRSLTGFCSSGNMMAIGWADSTLLQQSPARLKQLRGFMHRSYMEQAVQSGAMELPADFVKNTPEKYHELNGREGANGVIEGLVYLAEKRKNAAWDFACYICAITGHTKAELDATILNARYDVNGKVKLKYDIVIRFFRNTYGVDLQAIGNHP
jgi:hypothetical protein